MKAAVGQTTAIGGATARVLAPIDAGLLRKLTAALAMIALPVHAQVYLATGTPTMRNCAKVRGFAEFGRGIGT